MDVRSQWEIELETEGWAVVPGVLTETEVETCISLTWDWLESLGSGIDREIFYYLKLTKCLKRKK